MRRFVFGLVVGLMLSVGASYAQSFMMGWTVRVETNDGVTVTCNDPMIWPAIKQIECDGGDIE